MKSREAAEFASNLRADIVAKNCLRWVVTTAKQKKKLPFYALLKKITILKRKRKSF